MLDKREKWLRDSKVIEGLLEEETKLSNSWLGEIKTLEFLDLEETNLFP
jgi:hypothetical protein